MQLPCFSRRCNAVNSPSIHDMPRTVEFQQIRSTHISPIRTQADRLAAVRTQADLHRFETVNRPGTDRHPRRAEQPYPVASPIPGLLSSKHALRILRQAVVWRGVVTTDRAGAP